jgi:hypothetical protein
VRLGRCSRHSLAVAASGRRSRHRRFRRRELASDFYLATREEPRSLALSASVFALADGLDNSEDKIGEVTDLIADNNGNVTTAIVSVGGFLGVGKKDVAVPFKALKVASRDGKDWLVLNQTKQDLKMAPTFDKNSVDVGTNPAQ